MMENICYSDLPVLKDDLLVLRPIDYSDTENIIKWRNSSHVSENFIYREKLTKEIHLNWMKEKVETGKVIQYIIIYNELPIGSVYFRDISIHNESAEYGIFIGEEYAKGKGIGTRVAKLFVDFGFRILKLHKITLRVLAKNSIAISSYKNAGFQFEGYFQDMEKIDGKFQDVIFMGIRNY